MFAAYVMKTERKLAILFYNPLLFSCVIKHIFNYSHTISLFYTYTIDSDKKKMYFCHIKFSRL